jgi:predicted protein tyrosine phosphatase
MDYNQIDVLDKGTIWQGGTVDDTVDAPPFTGPLMIICMDKGEANDQWINHVNVESVLAVWIDDVPTGVLADNVLKGLAGMAVSWLQAGGNIYVHCAAGVSRASYMDIAIHCVANSSWSADQALAEIRTQRPIANPNPGFMAQLQRLWP